MTETKDGWDGFFGRDRLAETLHPTGTAPPSVVADAVLEAVSAFAAGAPQADDITVLAVRRA